MDNDNHDDFIIYNYIDQYGYVYSCLNIDAELDSDKHNDYDNKLNLFYSNSNDSFFLLHNSTPIIRIWDSNSSSGGDSYRRWISSFSHKEETSLTQSVSQSS